MANQERPAHEARRDGPEERGRYPLRPEWLRLETVTNVSLIVLGVYIVRALLSTSVNDAAGRIAVLAWAIAIPQLGFLALANLILDPLRYAPYPWYVLVSRSTAYGAAVVGFGAALWRLWIPASIALIASGIAGMVVFSFYLSRLERERRARGTS
jgi:hypothetical protein